MTTDPKPLTATERKSLERLVDNDYEALKGEIRAHAQKAIAEEKARVKEEFATRVGDVDTAQQELQTLTDTYEDAKTELERAYNADKSELISRWRGRSIIYTSSRYEKDNFTYEGLQNALNQVDEEVGTRLNEAIRRAERGRIDAQRKVLLGGLASPQALELVASIPSAVSVFQAETKELTSGV